METVLDMILGVWMLGYPLIAWYHSSSRGESTHVLNGDVDHFYAHIA